MLRLALALALLAPAAAAQAAYEVTVPLDSEDAEARAAFERGVELLHSFEYDDARDAFRQAQAADPEGLMPFWGEAMTHNHPVWQRQDAEAGLDVLSRLDARMAETGRGAVDAGVSSRWNYLEAVRILFGDGDPDTKEARDDAYLEHQAQFAILHTHDRDARAFHALALLGSAHEGRDYAIYGQAAEIAQSVLDEDSEHPGALHYLIHAYDDPDHAALALPAARAYSEIVSAASHALHMPTHIYFALGLWDEASALNVRAFEAARDASARRGEPLNNHGWHALYWLNYSELQRGEDARALALLTRADSLYQIDPSRLALSHLARIRAQTITHLVMDSDPTVLTTGGPFRDVQPLVTASLPSASAGATTEALDLAARLFVLVDQGDALVARIDSLAQAPDAPVSVRATALMLPPTDDVSQGLTLRYLAELAEAVDLVEASPITFGPPAPVLFPHEVMASVALSVGDYATTACLLDAVEARAPGRRLTASLRSLLVENLAPEAVPAETLPLPAVCTADG